MEENNFQIKENQMLFFVDYNKTLVNYNDIGMRAHSMFYDNYNSSKPLVSMRYLTKSLVDFEKLTGFTPVICVVSNASFNLKEKDGSILLLHDFFFFFFLNKDVNNEASCLRFFKYIVLRENDGFFKIIPNKKSFEESFEWVEFSEQNKAIKMNEQFRKCESVQRLLNVFDPNKISKNIFFAGDDIKDDYPMKLVKTNNGVCKIFVRPGRSRKLTYSKMREFCEAKGYEFSSTNQNNQKLRCFDNFTFKYINDKDKNALFNFNDGDHVVLTQANSDGLVEGIKKATEIILNSGVCQKQNQMQ